MTAFIKLTSSGQGVLILGDLLAFRGLLGRVRQVEVLVLYSQACPKPEFAIGPGQKTSQKSCQLPPVAVAVFALSSQAIDPLPFFFPGFFKVFTGPFFLLLFPARPADSNLATVSSGMGKLSVSSPDGRSFQAGTGRASLSHFLRSTD